VSSAARTGAPARLHRALTSDGVAEHIESLIFDGVLRSGDRIDRDEIAARLGVSRAPVQEALIRLERDGLVVLRYHRGAFVAPFDAETLREHFELYALLTGMASAKVADGPDPEVVERLRAVMAELAAAGEDAERQRSLRFEFRSLVNHAGAGPRLLGLRRATATFLPLATELAEPLPPVPAWRALRDELAAIERGDPEGARAAAAAQMELVGSRAVAELVRRGVVADERFPTSA